MGEVQRVEKRGRSKEDSELLHRQVQGKTKNKQSPQIGSNRKRGLKNIDDLREKVELEPITKNKLGTVSTFLTLGREYLSKSNMPAEERERFLQSILARQHEADRWLLLLKLQGQSLGFVHVKIDKDERPGWGFILEFYIIPEKRRLGWGSKLFTLVRKILQDKGVQNIWLLASPPSDSFWQSLGFQETGEKEGSQKVMVLSMPATS